MNDPRIEELATLLVDRCVAVQPGWQVLVMGHPPARPLLEELCRQIGRRGAYALLRLRLESPPTRSWMLEADEELVGGFTDIEAHDYAAMDTYIVVEAPENTRGGTDVPPSKVARRNAAIRPHTKEIFA